MKQFLIDMLSDSHSKSISSKRVIGLLGFVLLAINLSIPHKEPIQSELISAIEFITIASLFGTTAEKFSQIVTNRK